VTTLSEHRLQQLAGRLAELEARLASGTLEGEAFVAASRDYAELEPVARVASEVLAMRGELESLQKLDDPDPDMRALAEEEVTRPRRCWRSAPAPAATRPRCSPPTSTACTSATPPSRAGGWR
jgi:protein subunit release factor A